MTYISAPKEPAYRGCEFSITVEYEDRDGEFHEVEVNVVGEWRGHHYDADDVNPESRLGFEVTELKYDAINHPDFDPKSVWLHATIADEADRYYPEGMRYAKL